MSTSPEAWRRDRAFAGSAKTGALILIRREPA
jgi:hypothetical protein